MTAAAAHAGPVAKPPARHDAPAPASQTRAALELAGPGNLLQLLHAGGLRASLEVGGADDPEEHAADAFADAVTGGGGRAPCACGGSGCSSCSGGGAGSTVRRKAEGGAAAPATVAHAFRGPGRNLDLASRARFEPRTGLDLSRVRIHDDAGTATIARSIGARAYTVGNNIGFARGAWDPGSRSGQHLLAHELGHVALGHGGVRRVEDSDLWAKEVWREKQEEERKAAEQHHKTWDAAVNTKWQSQLEAQPKTMGEERDRLDLVRTEIQAKAFDLAGEDGSWLQLRLGESGYTGPPIAEVKQLWGKALISADALKLGSQAKPKDQPDAPPGVIPPELVLEAMTNVPAYYEAAKSFGAAVEGALKTWADGVNAAAESQYQEDLAAYNQAQWAYDVTCSEGMAEPGAGAACGGMALSTLSKPSAPNPVIIPPPVSTSAEKHMTRVQAAKTPAEWGLVASDLHASGQALGRLMVTSLSSSVKAHKAVQDQAAAVDALDSRLATFDKQNTAYKRIPAVFYPKDAGMTVKQEDGSDMFVPEAIPWQFYLVHKQKVDDDSKFCLLTGEWVLMDLTNPKAAHTKANSSAEDADKVMNGEWVDPPVGLFTPLNSALRFPEGELYFSMPSGQAYVHHMTEPWELSDYLRAASLFLAAAAMVAAVVMTAGAATPFVLAGGSALLSTGSTLAALREKDAHGLLTSKDINDAGFAIGMDILSVASMGLGRVVTAPGAALRFGSKFGAIASGLRLLRFASLGGNLIQATLVTVDLVQGFQAIRDNPNLDDATRKKMIGQLASRAMLTGVLTFMSLRGDINDIRQAGGLHITGVDTDGVPTVGKGAVDEGSAPKPHLDADAPKVSAEVGPQVHAAGAADGAGFNLGKERHAISVAGHGPTRDIYFCSDFCVSLTNRLSLVVEALKDSKAYKGLLDPCQDMLGQARKIRADLQAGKITTEAANAEAGKIADRLGRMTPDTNDGHVLQSLLNANPNALDNSMGDIRKSLQQKGDVGAVLDEATVKSTAMREDQLKDLFAKPGMNVRERGEGTGMFGDSDALPNYSPRETAKPYFSGTEGIPPKDGTAMAGTVRKLFDLPAVPGGEGTKNVAIAEAFIDGKSTLLTTVSGSDVKAGMVQLPDKTQFRVVNSGFQTRAQDTEAKLLEHLADRLPAGATGTIRLYTERAACNSCSGVIKQFEARFPGIKVIISFGS